MPTTELIAVLEEARARGFLGPGPVQAHIDHALALSGALPDFPGTFVDLGSGGGLPGLVIALDRPNWHGTLLDASIKRTDFLREAIAQLDVGERIDVWVGRAESCGRLADHRAMADAVVVRSFGPPAVAAECAAPLLRVGGLLVVSDPPSAQSAGDRWPADGLSKFGLAVVEHHTGTPAYTVLAQRTPCDDRYPRRSGMPAKRPHF